MFSAADVPRGGAIEALAAWRGLRVMERRRLLRALGGQAH